MTLCQHCFAPAESGLCFECVRRLDRELKLARWLVGELQVDVVRASVKGAGNGGRGSETPLLFDDDASEAAWILSSTVAAWCAELNYRSLTSDCQRIDFLIEHELDLARLETAGDCLDEISSVVEAGMKVVDRPESRTYLTSCGCARSVYARDDEAMVWCACGALYDVEQHRADNRALSRDLLVSAREASRLLGDVYGRSLAPNTVRQWASRGKLAAEAVDGVEKLYRLGDILDLCQDRNGRGSKSGK